MRAETYAGLLVRCSSLLPNYNKNRNVAAKFSWTPQCKMSCKFAPRFNRRRTDAVVPWLKEFRNTSLPNLQKAVQGTPPSLCVFTLRRATRQPFPCPHAYSNIFKWHIAVGRWANGGLQSQQSAPQLSSFGVPAGSELKCRRTWQSFRTL
jgi:hypothetical protein